MILVYSLNSDYFISLFSKFILHLRIDHLLQLLCHCFTNKPEGRVADKNDANGNAETIPLANVNTEKTMA